MKFTTTKMLVKSLSCLLLILLSLGACKKDALTVKQEKKFNQITTGAMIDLMSGGINLTLEPDGIANINPGGDIVWRATYKISGNKITVKVQQTNTTYKFTVISDEELGGENGVVLKLMK